MAQTVGSPARARARKCPTVRRALSAAVLLAMASVSGAAPPHADSHQDDRVVAPGRLLVQPRAGLSAAEFEKVLKPHGGKSIGKIHGTDVHVIQLPENMSEKAVAKLLEHHPHLKFAEPDVLLKSQSANDPYFGSAWHLSTVQAPEAWNTTMGANVTIAILDSGVDASHPDLAGRLVPGWNFYNNNADTSDVYGHGTLVAGTAAAASNNAIGVASVAGAAHIMPIRVTDSSGAGSLSQMAQGITWAADRGARVANLSFAGAGGYATVQNAAQYMKNKGGVVVTAAGNYGRQESFAPSDATIVVSATDWSDTMTSWSSYGNFVDIAAPGASIWTTTVGGGYGAVSGTSFSSPIAAGVAALIISANPALSAGDVENVLFSTATDLGASGFDMYYGRGRVNAAAAVQAARAAAARDTTAPTVSVASPGGGTTVKGIVPVDVAATDNVGVSRVDLVVNGVTVASDTAAPYAFSWDSTKVADGAATLKAYAYDVAGNYSSTSVTVTVANTTPAPAPADTVAPVPNISSPGADVRLTGNNVSVKATAMDNVAVRSMKLYIDGKLESTVNGSSLSYNWNIKKAAAGYHTLKVEAVDAAGNVGTHTIQAIK